MELRLNPLDTLFFRDGKPFTMGEETWADSRMLPNPSVVYGALRTAIAVVNNIDFKDIPTLLNDETFKITNTYYKAGGKDFFPLPLDLVCFKEELDKNKTKRDSYQTNLLEKTSLKSVLSNEKKGFKYLLHPKEFKQAESLENGVIEFTELKNYIKGVNSQFTAFKISDYIQSEPKIGNGRHDDTRSVLEGSLYRTDMYRYGYTNDRKTIQNVEIHCLVDFNAQYSLDKIGDSLVRLGGESKLIKINKMREEEGIDNTFKPLPFEKKQFKIYLASPAIFTNNDWKPDLEKLGINATLVAAAIGKTISIGGYDMVKNEPKTMYRAVPAGSVYYYESEEDVSAILNQLQGTSLSDAMPEQGFGIAYFAQF